MIDWHTKEAISPKIEEQREKVEATRAELQAAVSNLDYRFKYNALQFEVRKLVRMMEE